MRDKLSRMSRRMLSRQRLAWKHAGSAGQYQFSPSNCSSGKCSSPLCIGMNEYMGEIAIVICGSTPPRPRGKPTPESCAITPSARNERKRYQPHDEETQLHFRSATR